MLSNYREVGCLRILQAVSPGADSEEPSYESSAAVEIKGGIGWHSFRHSYRSWMDDTGAPLTVQQELMRHASITTTMNVYGKAMTDSKRQAHSKVVQMVLKEPGPVLEKQDLAIGA